MYNLTARLQRPNLTVAAIIIVVAALCTGCIVQSKNPLYSPDKKDVVFLPALLGTWYDEDGMTTMIFERSGEKSYSMTIEEEKEEPEGVSEFEVHLVQLGDFLFLDMDTSPLIKKNKPTDKDIQRHMFGRIWIEGDTLRLAGLDADWFRDHREEFGIEHELIEEDRHKTVVLTADTPGLQRFILEHVEDPEVFLEADPWHRTPAR